VIDPDLIRLLNLRQRVRRALKEGASSVLLGALFDEINAITDKILEKNYENNR